MRNGRMKHFFTRLDADAAIRQYGDCSKDTEYKRIRERKEREAFRALLHSMECPVPYTPEPPPKPFHFWG
jgi:hypothetical protein